MRIVLAHPALAGERLDRRGAAVGRVFIERHVLVDLHHQRMQKPEHVVFRFRSQFARKRRHRGVDFGQRRRAQEQARRKALVGAPQHAAGVVGLDQAFDRDGEIGERPMGQHMGDIAEGVLMHIEAGIGGDVDLPFGDILPVMAAGRHPQDLDDAGGRRFVTVAGGMGNSQAHGVPAWSSRFQTIVIARSEATKQSIWRQGKDGLLRCARNDVVGVATTAPRSPAMTISVKSNIVC